MELLPETKTLWGWGGGWGGCFHHFQLAVMLEYRAADLQYQDQKHFSRRNWSLKCGLKQKEGLSKQHCTVLLMCL